MSFKLKDKENETVEDTKNVFTLSTGHSFPSDNDKEFAIGFKIKLSDSVFELDLEMHFVFSLTESVTEDFKTSDFVKINAPAIAYPYVRSYVSNLTLQSGISPIIIPTVNFVALAKSKENLDVNDR